MFPVLVGINRLRLLLVAFAVSKTLPHNWHCVIFFSTMSPVSDAAEMSLSRSASFSPSLPSTSLIFPTYQLLLFPPLSLWLQLLQPLCTVGTSYLHARFTLDAEDPRRPLPFGVHVNHCSGSHQTRACIYRAVCSILLREPRQLDRKWRSRGSCLHGIKQQLSRFS